RGRRRPRRPAGGAPPGVFVGVPRQPGGGGSPVRPGPLPGPMPTTPAAPEEGSHDERDGHDPGRPCAEGEAPGDVGPGRLPGGGRRTHPRTRGSAGGGVRRRPGRPGARRRSRHRQRRDPRRPGGRRGGGVRPDARTARDRAPAGGGPGRAAELGDRRRRRAALRGRLLRHRPVLRRRHVRPAPPGRRRRTAAGLPARRPHRPGALDARGFIGRMLATLKPYAPPPPPGAQPPPLWGDENHVRELLGDRISDVTAERRTVVVDRLASPEEFRDFFKTRYGPVMSVYASLAGDPDRTAALDRDLADLGRRHDRGGEGEGTVLDWEYLLFTARRTA